MTTTKNEFFDTDINKAYAWGYAEGARGEQPHNRSNVNPLWNRAYHMGIADGIVYALKNGLDLTCSVRWVDAHGNPTPHATPVKAQYFAWLCGHSCAVYGQGCDEWLKTFKCHHPVVPYPTHAPLAVCEHHIKTNKLDNWILVPMESL